MSSEIKLKIASTYKKEKNSVPDPGFKSPDPDLSINKLMGSK